jgi:hypothetical protein
MARVKSLGKFGLKQSYKAVGAGDSLAGVA